MKLNENPNQSPPVLHFLPSRVNCPMNSILCIKARVDFEIGICFRSQIISVKYSLKFLPGADWKQFQRVDIECQTFCWTVAACQISLSFLERLLYNSLCKHQKAWTSGWRCTWKDLELKISERIGLN